MKDAFVDNANLTGVWHGSYRDDRGDSAFVATIIHTGSSIGGTVHEEDTTTWFGAMRLYAMLSGGTDGHTVDFTKSYDGTGGWDHSVFYTGVVADGGAEIHGTWRIPSSPESYAASGEFLMIRRSSKTKTERKVAVTVD